MLLIAFVLVLLSSAPADAARCTSREEARAKWPNTYLYWHYGDRKQKCWSNVRRKQRYARQFFVDIVTWEEFNRIDDKAPAAAPSIMFAPPTLLERFYGER